MKFLKIAGLLLAVFFISLVCLWWACSPHEPSDAQLEREFYAHRADLDRLVAMMDEDWQMSRIGVDFTWRQDSLKWPRPESEWGISKARWDEYRAIFRKVGSKDGLTRREKSSDIIVDMWSWGIVPAGIGVGYLHCGQPRNGYAHTEIPCNENRDFGGDPRGRSGSYGYRYKKIEPDWFIYEESN